MQHSRLALILDGEADGQKISMLGGVASNIGDTGTLFEGEATSIGLSLYYSLNQNSGINFADSKVSAMMMALIIGVTAKRAPKNIWT